eukprot:768718-Hanusia_phi.AAC.4
MAGQTVCVNARVRDGYEETTRTVNLDLDMIKNLFYLKQEDAAVQLVRILKLSCLVPVKMSDLFPPSFGVKVLMMSGISLTSLKTACRKLGISRWPYSRTRSASLSARDSPRASPSDHMESAMHDLEEGGSHPSMGCIEVYGDESMVDEWMVDVEMGSQRDFVELALSVLPKEQDWIDWYVRSDDSEPTVNIMNVWTTRLAYSERHGVGEDEVEENREARALRELWFRAGAGGIYEGGKTRSMFMLNRRNLHQAYVVVRWTSSWHLDRRSWRGPASSHGRRAPGEGLA